MVCAARRAALCLIAVGPGMAHVFRMEDAVDSGSIDAQSLLQHNVELKVNKPMCAPVRKYMEDNMVVFELCGNMNISNPRRPAWEGTHIEVDLDRPLKHVQAEHPGNLYPYFGSFGNINAWITPGIGSMDGQGYAGYKRSLTMPAIFSLLRGPPVSFRWSGHHITTHADTCQVGDDPYCYSLGWMKNQAQDQKLDLGRLMNDAEAWSRLGQQECKAIKEEYGFDDEQITLGGHIRETNDMYVKTERTCDWHEPGQGPPATDSAFKKHAYAKCFLNNVTTEMAYCYFRGCVLKTDASGRATIGHGRQCGY